jgi:hypothetical protein
MVDRRPSRHLDGVDHRAHHVGIQLQEPDHDHHEQLVDHDDHAPAHHHDPTSGHDNDGACDHDDGAATTHDDDGSPHDDHSPASHHDHHDPLEHGHGGRALSRWS